MKDAAASVPSQLPTSPLDFAVSSEFVAIHSTLMRFDSLTITALHLFDLPTIMASHGAELTSLAGSALIQFATFEEGSPAF